MRVSIICATYGPDEYSWRTLAHSRALPSTRGQGAHEIIYNHHHKGPIALARNLFAADAEGDWLCFLDADDELAPGYLEAMRQALGGLPSSPQAPDVLLTPAVSYIAKNTHYAPKFPHDDYPSHTLQDDNFLVIGTLIRKETFHKVGGFSDYPHGFEDWSLWAKAWKAGAEIVRVPDAVYRAYVNPVSKHRQQWKDREWQAEMHETVRRDVFPELYA